MIKTTAKKLICPSALVAETLAVREAAQYAKQQSLKRVNIKFDSNVAISEIHNNSGGNLWEIMAIVQEIQGISQQMTSMTFAHIRKEQNQVAHWLSKNVFLDDVLEDEGNIPRQLGSLLLTDIVSSMC